MAACFAAPAAAAMSIGIELFLPVDVANKLYQLTREERATFARTRLRATVKPAQCNAQYLHARSAFG